VVYPAGVLFANNSLPYSLNGPGKISGSTGLTNAGTAGVVVTANNDNTGPTLLASAGTLQLGDGGTLGSLGSGDVQATAEGAILAYNRSDSLTLPNRVYGSSATQPLVRVNSGTLTLTGTLDNAWAGAEVNSGTLVLAKSSSASVHAVGGTNGLVVNAGGTAQLGGTGGDQIVNARSITLVGGAFDLNGQTETANGLTGYGRITNSGAAASLNLTSLTVTGGTLELQGGAIKPQGGTGQGVLDGATLRITGGSVETPGYLRVNGYLDVSGGSISSALEILSGFGGAGATNTVANGGVISAWQYRPADASDSTTYVLTNGTLVSAEIAENGSGSPGVSAVYLNGGTIARGTLADRVNTNWIHNLDGFFVQQGGGAIDVGTKNMSINIALQHDPALAVADGGLTKLGVGALLLNGTNTYTGPTVVAAGTLGGSGVIQGPVVVRTNAVLAPGALIGTLSIQNALTLDSGSTTLVEINATNGVSDLIQGVTAASFNGTLAVTNVAGAANPPALGQSFQLFSAPATVTGNFASITPALPTGLAWNFNPTNGVLSVVQGYATYPTNITAAVSGSTLTISWPATHAGWLLQAQTNTLGVGLSGNWTTVPGSGSTTSMPFPMDANNGTVFFRLVAP
jgi:autotransporter-associated beta strand protein